MRDVLTFGLVAFSAIFFVVDPLAVLPIFLAMTANETPQQKRATAWRAAITCGITLTVFAAAGSLIFRFFGITLGAFKIAGGVLLFLVALDMMQARQSRTRSTPEEEQEGIEKADVAIIPLAIPLLSGPGSIATVMVLMSRHTGFIYEIPVFLSIFLTAVITWLMLRGAEWIERRLSKTFMNVVMRVMGLILAAISVEFVIAGIKDVLPTIRP
ncbi:MAG TPA: MarC family protein [Polyangia bacterium]|nr:MarC family protein [Polyangia bacterium]